MAAQRRTKRERESRERGRGGGGGARSAKDTTKRVKLGSRAPTECWLAEGAASEEKVAVVAIKCRRMHSCVCLFPLRLRALQVGAPSRTHRRTQATTSRASRVECRWAPSSRHRPGRPPSVTLGHAPVKQNKTTGECVQYVHPRHRVRLLGVPPPLNRIAHGGMGNTRAPPPPNSARASTKKTGTAGSRGVARAPPTHPDEQAEAEKGGQAATVCRLTPATA